MSKLPESIKESFKRARKRKEGRILNKKKKKKKKNFPTNDERKTKPACEIICLPAVSSSKKQLKELEKEKKKEN